RVQRASARRRYERRGGKDRKRVAEVLVLDQTEDDSRAQRGHPEEAASGALPPDRPETPDKEQNGEQAELGWERGRVGKEALARNRGRLLRDAGILERAVHALKR